VTSTHTTHTTGSVTFRQGSDDPDVDSPTAVRYDRRLLVRGQSGTSFTIWKEVVVGVSPTTTSYIANIGPYHCCPDVERPKRDMWLI